MKNVFVFLIFTLYCSNGCNASHAVTKISGSVVRQVAPDTTLQKVDFSDPSTWIIGYFSVNKLFQEPYSTWFVSGYDNYNFNSQAVEKLKEIEKSDLLIKIIMGTWCSDSQREVPRFMKVMNVSGFPGNEIQLIGVDNDKNSPVASFDSLNIQKVPTFIIYKNNIEVGRIIETPATSLEQDMVKILTGNQ